MRKKLAIGVLASLCLMMATSAQALDLTEYEAGTTLTIDDTNTNGELEFNPSPGVQMAVASEDSTYVIMSLNTSAALDNQNEYGIHSGYSGYYQNNTTTADTFSVESVTVTDGDLEDPFADWTAMGGAGGASGS